MSEEEKKAAPAPADNTKTQKTMRLRPIPALKRPATAPAVTPAVTPATSASSAAANTATKKTIKLKPMMPKVAAAERTVDPLAVTMPKGHTPSTDTQTKKTVRLKPIMPSIASRESTVDPLAIPAAKPIDDINDTKTRKAVLLSQADPTVKPTTIDIGGAGDDRTVKVKRPAPLAGTPIKPTLKLNRPAAAPAARAVPPPPPASAVKPAAPAAPVAEPDFTVDSFDDEEKQGLYQILMGISAVALLGTAVLLAGMYFDLF